MDVVEIGLVYDIEFPKPGTVKVIYSLTSPACPAGPQITADMVNAVRVLPGVEDVEPELVWSPHWTPDRMSDDAKFILGIG
jgi:metal-sulfur cluster biosynthetic enzyme